MQWDPHKRIYRGSVADPNYHWRGVLASKKLRPAAAKSSEAYDHVARWFFAQAKGFYPRLRIETQHGMITIRRVYQAPCPAGNAQAHFRKGVT